MFTERRRSDKALSRHGARSAATFMAATTLFVLAPSPASAHDPIFVNDSTPAEQSPLIVDGSVSFATYGVIEEPGGSGHVRLDLEADDELVVELLVPDQAPENTLVDFSHLRVTVLDPSGAQTVLAADTVLGKFDEPFTGTSYLQLIENTEPALPGTYTVTVTSEIPTRFTLATGRTEQFGTPVQGYERQPLTELDSWYATPPPTTPVDETLDGTQPGGPTNTEPSTTGPDEVQNDDAASDIDSESTSPAVVLVLAAVVIGAAAIGVGLALRRRTRSSRPTEDALQ